MFKRLTAVFVAALLLAALALPVSALPFATGETDGYTEEIYDGVYHTYIATEGSPYGKQKLNIVEFDLAQRDLDVEILKGDYIVSKKTVAGYVNAYNSANAASGKKVLAAVNGDLWMTGVHSNTKVTKSVLMVPRGVLISDGVVYCSSQIPNEATYSTNGEGHSYFWAFGITEDYVPVVGQPLVSLTVKNTSKSTSAQTNALNRLPAHDSLVIYDSNCNYTNYALDDAYEVVLTDVTGEFKCGTTVSGKVSAIYSESDGTSPTLSDGCVVLTARGSAVASIADYAVGDTVDIDMTITDLSSRDNDWSKVVTAIGGHIPLVLDGVSTQPADATKYPATIVGFKNDGKIIFIQNDGRQPLWSEGLAFNTADDLMTQLGVNCAINLDGGGSSTMIVGDELVNKPSDGSARAVINGIAVVSCPERDEQAEFMPNLPYRFNGRYLECDTVGAANLLAGGNVNATSVKLCDGYIRFTPTQSTNDPFVYYNTEAAFNSLNANNYKYFVIKYRTSEKVTTPSTELFLCAGNISGPTGGYSVSFSHGTAGEWNTQIVDLSSLSYWSGKIHGVRLDYFAGVSDSDEYFDVEYIAFAKTLAVAEGYANGTEEIPTVVAESTSITLKSGSGYTLKNGVISGVASGSTAYDLLNGVNGAKLEMFDSHGNSVRNGSLCTGYTICSYNTALEKCDTLTVAVAGDLNGDGNANSVDAALILKASGGLASLTELETIAGDVNGDGDTNSIDAAYILKKAAGLVD